MFSAITTVKLLLVVFASPATETLGASLWPLDESSPNEAAANGFDQQPQQLLYAADVPITRSSLQMPGVSTAANETYLCTSYPLNVDDTNYIVGFNPIADMKGVHHVLLFGCEAPGSAEPVWNCGEMTGGSAHSPVCTAQPNILYAWAHNAPMLELPKGVAFPVGAGTRNRHLVLQVHYMHAMKEKDYSGVEVFSTLVPQPKTAATLLLVTGGAIQPQSTEMLEAACVVDEPVEIHPFAFRVHTHRHGVNVNGWVVRENPMNGEDKWRLLGERDPQKPQLFEMMKNRSEVITQGDILAARCKIKNNEKRVINVGPTGEDEMCNFYLMYWVDGDRTLSDNVCFSPGAPSYYWGREAGLNHIPK